MVSTNGKDFQPGDLNKILHKKKMETAELFSRGIAHDINNMLHVIDGYLLYLEDFCTNVQEGIEQCRKSVEKSSKLIRELVEYSSDAKVEEHEKVSLFYLFQSLKATLPHSLPRNIDVQIVLPDKETYTKGSYNRIENAILNLVFNARDAMPEGGRLEIECRRTQLDEEFVASHPGSVAGAYWGIRVSDNGTGIPEEIRDKILTPFFTTKPVGIGTGLGLAIVYRTIKDMDGYTDFVSEIGKGTTFTLYLKEL